MLSLFILPFVEFDFGICRNRPGEIVYLAVHRCRENFRGKPRRNALCNIISSYAVFKGFYAAVRESNVNQSLIIVLAYKYTKKTAYLLFGVEKRRRNLFFYYFCLS